MSESKFTPGPWLITPDGAFVYALNERGTNVFWTHVQRGWKGKDAEFRTDSDEVEANAKLIAAAPDLLAAAVEALAVIDRIKPVGNGFGTQVRLAAAIAKATA